MLRLKAPGDKRCKATRLFLKSAHHFEMVDALIERLTHAEHHGRSSAHTELVGGPMHVNPVVSATLEPRNALAHIVIENLRAAARNGIESRIPQARNRVAQAQFAVLGDGEGLRSRQAMQPDLRKPDRKSTRLNSSHL